MASAIISAVIAHLIPILEEEFVKHEPEMQAALIHEAKALSLKIDEWAKSKLQKKGG